MGPHSGGKCMRRLGLAALVFSIQAFATPSLNDITYKFDAEKMSTVESSEHFFTSFVEYYYLLLDSNRSQLQSVRALGGVEGWCAGDAHPGNFGVLIMDDGSIRFTINDMDDAGPCPVVMDFLRFLTAAKLTTPNIKVQDLVSAYLDGLSSHMVKAPNVVLDLLNKSAKRGKGIKPGSVVNGKLLRDPNSRELDSLELAKIVAAVKAYSAGMTLVDSFATAKVGGGSGGLLRYEMLFDAHPGFIHLELKTQVTPSTWPVATRKIPPTADRIQKTLKLEQGALASRFYQVTEVSGVPMLLRPRFYGNVAVKLIGNDSPDDIDYLSYEAFVLGQLHAQSVSDVKTWAAQLAALPGASLAIDVDALSKHFEQKFAELKGR